jgi:hypothetical protein
MFISSATRCNSMTENCGAIHEILQRLSSISEPDLHLGSEFNNAETIRSQTVPSNTKPDTDEIRLIPVGAI